MKLLNELDQYGERLTLIDGAIRRNKLNLESVNKDIHARQNWGMFSFVSLPLSTIYYMRDGLKLNIQLLEDYREMILDLRLKYINK